MVKNTGNGVADRAHYLLDRTLCFFRVRTFGAFLVGGLAHAADWSQRTVKDSNDLTQRNVFGLLDQSVAAFHASATRKQSGSFQSQKNLFQEFKGDVLSVGNVVTLQRPSSMGKREFEKGAKAVFAFF